MQALYSPARRRVLRSLAAAPVFSALPFSALAQAAPPYSPADLAHAASLRDQALRSNLAFNLMASLVSEVGPRAAGSPGDAKAVKWALGRLAALGFSNVRAEPVPLLA